MTKSATYHERQRRKRDERRARILTYLVDLGRKRGGASWPTHRFLAERFDVTERTVDRDVLALREAGHLEYYPRYGRSAIKLASTTPILGGNGGIGRDWLARVGVEIKGGDLNRTILDNAPKAYIRNSPFQNRASCRSLIQSCAESGPEKRRVVLRTPDSQVSQLLGNSEIRSKSEDLTSLTTVIAKGSRYPALRSPEENSGRGDSVTVAEPMPDPAVSAHWLDGDAVRTTWTSGAHFQKRVGEPWAAELFDRINVDAAGLWHRALWRYCVTRRNGHITLVQFRLGEFEKVDGRRPAPRSYCRAMIHADGTYTIEDDKPIVTNGARLARHYHSITDEAERLDRLERDCKRLDNFDSWCPMELVSKRLIRAGRIRDLIARAAQQPGGIQ